MSVALLSAAASARAWRASERLLAQAGSGGADRRYRTFLDQLPKSSRTAPTWRRCWCTGVRHARHPGEALMATGPLARPAASPLVLDTVSAAPPNGLPGRPAGHGSGKPGRPRWTARSVRTTYFPRAWLPADRRCAGSVSQKAGRAEWRMREIRNRWWDTARVGPDLAPRYAGPSARKSRSGWRPSRGLREGRSRRWRSVLAEQRGRAESRSPGRLALVAVADALRDFQQRRCSACIASIAN